MYCIKCNSYYIGETSLILKKRLASHLYCIKKYIPFLNETSEVGEHFSRKNHDYNSDLKFFIFKNNVIDGVTRKSIETEIIQFFYKSGCTVINALVKRDFKSSFTFNL